MKTTVLATVLVGSMLPTLKATAQQNSAELYPNVLEMRESGRHALYIGPSALGPPTSVPDEGCSLMDRALLDENSPGTAAIVQALASAIVTRQRVSIRVHGCLEILPGSSTTAPRIVKINFLTGY